MPRALTNSEAKILRKLLMQVDLYSSEDAKKIETIKQWFLEEEQDLAEKAIEYFAQSPDFPIDKTQDGRVYVNPSGDISEWLDRTGTWEDIEKVPDNKLREMVSEIREMNEELLGELSDERQKAERFRQSRKRWSIASLLISLLSFIVGFITGFGFL